MTHEPRALVRHAKHPVKLMGAHALLAGTEQVKRKEPLVQRNVAVFHDGSDRNAELFPASRALPETLARARFRLRLKIGFQPVRFANHPAVWTDRAIRPALCFHELARLLGVLKVGSDDCGLFHASIIALWRGFVKGKIQIYFP